MKAKARRDAGLGDGRTLRTRTRLPGIRCQISGRLGWFAGRNLRHGGKKVVVSLGYRYRLYSRDIGLRSVRHVDVGNVVACHANFLAPEPAKERSQQRSDLSIERIMSICVCGKRKP